VTDASDNDNKKSSAEYICEDNDDTGYLLLLAITSPNIEKCNCRPQVDRQPLRS
jgi:hypothetical protein